MAHSEKPTLPATIRTWEDDPGTKSSAGVLIERPRTVFPSGRLQVAIYQDPPHEAGDVPGTAEFRYWTAADALVRTVDFWRPLMPSQATWHSKVGATLKANLDGPNNLNATYNRSTLDFGHQEVEGAAEIYTCESPDIVCHEVGHPLLDALQSKLWGAASTEAAALHESFGDISALLAALQLESMRQAVLTATKGELARSSRLSRLAEQVGWGLRQEEPDSAEPDCLRDAANTFVYRPPGDLQPKAPAVQLSRSSHSFCRVFTGAFLKALAGVFRLREKQNSEGLAEVSVVMGRLLVAAVLAAPVDTRYFAQVAAHLLAADRQLYGGAHLPALRTAFVRAGILSQDEAASLSVKSMAPHAKAIAKEIGKARPSGLGADLPTLTLASDPYGLTQELSVPAAVEPARFDVAGWDPLSGAAWGAGDPEREAATFVSDLFALGHVVVPESCLTTAATMCEATGATHEIVADDVGNLTLNRLFFD